VVLDDVSAEAVQGEASAGGGRSLDGEIDLATDLLVGLHGRVWASPARFWSGSTAPRRCVRPSSTCSITRRGNAVNHPDNVKDRLPQRLRGSVGRRDTDAYHADQRLRPEQHCSH
jgi:putative transposase